MLGGAVTALTLAACSKQPEQSTTTTTTTTTEATNTAAAAPAAAPAAAAPAAANTDTVSGAKFADFTGNAASGKTVFIQCKTCHEVTPGVNKIGPSLAGIVGRKASSIATFTYSPANHNSGITWTPEKLFQYLENPQRVVPGTKMAFAGIPDPQKRADVIAYLTAPN
ncbi:cytochrome c family protein [Sphingomonas sp. SUN019]|nr:cytochrome c family protein [Sphingomonas sp. SUN019]